MLKISALPNVSDMLNLLVQLRCVLDQATTALARGCAKGAGLDADLLDAQQVATFELAWASAELLAAQRSLEALEGGASEVDQHLVRVFALEAVSQVRNRLEGVLAELDMDDTALQALAADPRLRAWRRTLLSGEALQYTAGMLAERPEEIGRVDMSGDLSLIQDQFRRFAADVVAPLAEQIHRHDLIVPDQLLSAMRDMGVFGLSIPEQYGGSAVEGQDETLTMIVVTEALSEASLAAAGSLITRPEILSRALLAGGTEQQKQHWLPRLAEGDPLCAIAITEPDYGSDVAGLTLRGTRCEGGWLLNGAKTWCTFAGKAGVLMVVTRTDPDRSLGHRGLSLLLAEKPSYDGHEFDYHQPGGGRLSGRAIPTIGYRGMHSFDLSFENFFVPDANVIGEQQGLGKGFYYTMSGMTGGRMQTAGRASGVMRAALLAAIRYAGERKVFGAPLANYPLSAAKLVKMAARYAASRYLAYSVGRRLAQGGASMEASLVKLFACRSAELVTREALQIHGGMGYAEEVAVSRYFVDARVLSIFEGAEETLALKVIGRSLLEAALGADAA
ncbi:acyl-CoA dehydrogenase family protein [Pseudomonas sp. TCU-HL1]|uniref:acyl-CoA dehydrogenase family protein n=1 Tax=Pseudomonas sp. TCU-HL1 TaxID=1856685 RepID=UPI000857A997|nr:acyl-CoA dehydrogenase family protein [Pseudomonas sp. TCU-HL1]AOE86781.1 acyl-CoA dehydrogenase [Pseudomonas sp. TCU-HL1]